MLRVLFIYRIGRVMEIEKMKEVIAKLERILELTSTHGICINGPGMFATDESQLEYVESKIRLNAIQALDIFDKNNIEKQKPRTKTEFVKAKMTPKEIFSEMLNGEEFYVFKEDLINFDGEQFWRHTDEGKSRITFINHEHEIYRKVETEIDERQEFIDTACAINEKAHGERRQYLVESMYDSGKFKLVE